MINLKNGYGIVSDGKSYTLKKIYDQMEHKQLRKEEEK